MKSSIHKPISDDGGTVETQYIDLKEHSCFPALILGFCLGSAATVLGLFIYAYLFV